MGTATQKHRDHFIWGHGRLSLEACVLFESDFTKRYKEGKIDSILLSLISSQVSFHNQSISASFLPGCPQGLKSIRSALIPAKGSRNDHKTWLLSATSLSLQLLTQCNLQRSLLDLLP